MSRIAHPRETHRPTWSPAQMRQDHQDLHGLLVGSPSRPPERVLAHRTPEPRRLLGVREVAETLSCSRVQLWRLVRKGLFPRPLPPQFGRRPKWRAVDVEAHLAAIASDGKEAEGAA